MSLQNWWTTERLDVAKSVLASYVGWCDDARVEISDRLGRAVTYDALCHALKRTNGKPPGAYCGGHATGTVVDPSIDITMSMLGHDRGLIIPDVHAPFHDERAVDLTVETACKRGTDTIVCLGDLVDCYSVSSFVKSPELASLTLEQEIESANLVLDNFDAIGAKRKVITLGNHCDRVDRYIAKHAAPLYGLVQLPKLLRLAERGWKCVAYGDYEVIGKIAYTHDLDNYGALAHTKARDELGKSCVIGHTHRMALACDSTICGGPRVGAMFGTLADFEKAAKYMKRAKLRHWQLGFGTNVMLDDGVTFLRPHPIVGYRCEVDGRVYCG